MKKRNVLLVFFTLLVFIGLESVSAIDVSIDNYYPTPVEAGEYLNVWLKVSNYGAADVEKSVVKLKPSFPFSLDPGEPEEIVISSIKEGGFVIVKMKIRVDAGAKEGDNKLTFQYADYIGDQWKEKSMSVTVVESQTFFDVVLQELNQEGVFIAIANIGKNPANAVTVRIPEQEHFRTQLVSASIVGNLESGDYTLVGFQVIPKGAKFTGEEKELLVHIDYTDSLGIRRTLIKKILLNPSSLTQMSSEEASGGMRSHSGQGLSFLRNTWFWVSIVLLVIMIGKAVYRKVKKRRG